MAALSAAKCGMIKVVFDIIENALLYFFDFGADGLGELILLDIVRAHDHLIIVAADHTVESTVFHIELLARVITVEFEADSHFIQDVAAQTAFTFLSVF